MRSDLQQRLRKLAFVTPAMDPAAQQPDQQMLLAQQALGQPAIDPTTGQPMSPPIDPATGQPASPQPGGVPPGGAAPPPGGALPPGAAGGGGAPPGVDPSTMAGVAPGMDPTMGGPPPTGLDPAAMGMDPAMAGGGGGMPPPGADPGADPSAGGGAPVVSPTMPDAIACSVADPNSQQGALCAIEMQAAQQQASQPKMAELRAVMDTWGRSKAAAFGYGEPTFESPHQSNVYLMQTGSHRPGFVEHLPKTMSEADPHGDQYRAEPGAWENTTEPLYLDPEFRKVLDYVRFIADRHKTGPGAGPPYQPMPMTADYAPPGWSPDWAKSPQASKEAGAGVKRGQSMHPHTPSHATQYLAKVANFARLTGTPMGAVAGQMGSMPSLSQQMTTAMPGLMAPKVPQAARPMAAPQPVMGMNAAGRPVSGPLGSRSGISALSGPAPLTGMTAGNAGAVTKTADMTDPRDWPVHGPLAMGAGMLGAGALGGLGAGLSVMPTGAGLGGAAGGLIGFGRGNTAEGLGRGVIRGSLTAGGMGLGAGLGAGLGGAIGQFGGPVGALAGAGLGGLGGAGLGTYGGWRLGGHLLGEPVGAGKHPAKKHRTKKGAAPDDGTADPITGMPSQPDAGDVAMPPQDQGPPPSDPGDGAGGSYTGGEGGKEPGPPSPEEVNLRGATSAAVSCGACGNFDGQNCGLLQTPVQATQTCDAFSPSAGMAGIDTGPITQAGMDNKPVFKTARTKRAYGYADDDFEIEQANPFMHGVNIRSPEHVAALLRYSGRLAREGKHKLTFSDTRFSAPDHADYTPEQAARLLLTQAKGKTFKPGEHHPDDISDQIDAYAGYPNFYSLQYGRPGPGAMAETQANHPVLKAMEKYKTWPETKQAAGIHPSPVGGRVYERPVFGLFGPSFIAKTAQDAAAPPAPPAPEPNPAKKTPAAQAAPQVLPAFRGRPKAQPGRSPLGRPNAFDPNSSTSPTAQAALERRLAQNRLSQAAQSAAPPPLSQAQMAQNAAGLRNPNSPIMPQNFGNGPQMTYNRQGPGSFNGQPIPREITPYGMQEEQNRLMAQRRNAEAQANAMRAQAQARTQAMRSGAASPGMAALAPRLPSNPNLPSEVAKRQQQAAAAAQAAAAQRAAVPQAALPQPGVPRAPAGPTNIIPPGPRYRMRPGVKQAFFDEPGATNRATEPSVVQVREPAVPGANSPVPTTTPTPGGATAPTPGVTPPKVTPPTPGVWDQITARSSQPGIRSPGLFSQPGNTSRSIRGNTVSAPTALGLGGLAYGMSGDDDEEDEDPRIRRRKAEMARRRRLAAMFEAEATGKMAMVKQAMPPYPLLLGTTLGGLALGAPAGAMMAPPGHRWEGAGRGMWAGRGTIAGGVGGGLGGVLLGSELGKALGGDTYGGMGGAIGAGLGGVTGAVGGNAASNWMMGPPSWEREEHKHKKHHEKEGHYPGCKSSRKAQGKQHKAVKRRMRRKHASVALIGSLMGIVKQAAAIKCGCGCSTCAKCGSGEKQKVRVINGPQVRTNKGHFAWRGRNAKSVTDVPMYDHFGTKAAAIGAHAAALALATIPA